MINGTIAIEKDRSLNTFIWYASVCDDFSISIQAF